MATLRERISRIAAAAEGEGGRSVLKLEIHRATPEEWAEAKALHPHVARYVNLGAPVAHICWTVSPGLVVVVHASDETALREVREWRARRDGIGGTA